MNGLRLVLVSLAAAMAGCATLPSSMSSASAIEPVEPDVWEDPPPPDPNATGTGVINGVVTNTETGERLSEALVILQSSVLYESHETQTNAQGLYQFKDLPPGTYTIQVLSGKADVSKVATLPKGAKFRANFTLDPTFDGIVCRLPSCSTRKINESLFSIDSTEAHLLGISPTKFFY